MVSAAEGGNTTSLKTPPRLRGRPGTIKYSTNVRQPTSTHNSYITPCQFMKRLSRQVQNRSEAYYFGVSFIPTFDIIAAHSIIHFRSMNQFANFRCAIAVAPIRNDRLTSGSRRHKTGKQTVIAQYCSLHERSSLRQRQLLASKKVEPIKCSAHIWVDCHL